MAATQVALKPQRKPKRKTERKRVRRTATAATNGMDFNKAPLSQQREKSQKKTL